MSQLKFKSVKSQIRRDKKLTEIKERKAAKRLMKAKKLKELRRENPDVRIDEESFLGSFFSESICLRMFGNIFSTSEDSDSDEEVEPLYIPKVGNSILWIKYTTADTIWMAVGEFDCGYVYEYDISKSDPLHCIELKRAIDMEVNSFVQM